MKITEDVRKCAAEQGIAAEEALKQGMDAKSQLKWLVNREPCGSQNQQTQKN